MNFCDVGIKEEDFYANLDEIAMLAFEDQCCPCNPRVPMVEDMKKIMIKAYKGN